MSSFESTKPKSKSEAVNRVHRYLANRAQRIASEGKLDLVWLTPQVLDVDSHANDQEEVDENFVAPGSSPYETLLDIPTPTLTYERVLDLSVPAPAPAPVGVVPRPGPVPPRQDRRNQSTQDLADPNRRRVQVHPGHPYPLQNSNPAPRPQGLPRHRAPPDSNPVPRPQALPRHRTDGQTLGMTAPQPPLHRVYPQPYPPQYHSHSSMLNAQAHTHAQCNHGHLLGEDEDAQYKRHLQSSLGLVTNADPGFPRGMEGGMVGGSGSAYHAPNVPAFSHGHGYTHGRVQGSRGHGYRQSHLGQDEDANFKRNLHNRMGITNVNANDASFGGYSGAMGSSSMGRR
ncbi:hypothetical protein VKT23_008029 [Stygiomarasmius scandens]|uniref:Uncharacterized protein n=1 Tax=Marasmiellus scandens TaxID=2682957 RepID=A0ABR1JLA2_9AGAR